MIAVLSVAFIVAILFVRKLFTLTGLSFPSMLVMSVFILLSYPVMLVFTRGLDKLRDFINAKREEHAERKLKAERDKKKLKRRGKK